MDYTPSLMYNQYIISNVIMHKNNCLEYIIFGVFVNCNYIINGVLYNHKIKKGDNGRGEKGFLEKYT